MISTPLAEAANEFALCLLVGVPPSLATSLKFYFATSAQPLRETRLNHPILIQTESSDLGRADAGRVRRSAAGVSPSYAEGRSAIRGMSPQCRLDRAPLKIRGFPSRPASAGPDALRAAATAISTRMRLRKIF